MEVDGEGLPFIRLEPPHNSIVITPPRYADGDVVIVDFNDPRVYMNLASPPFPFTRKDWDEQFSKKVSLLANKGLEEWRKVEIARRDNQSTEAERWVGSAMPMSAIREVDVETGEQKFIGNIQIRRRGFMTILDEEERKVAAEDNNSMLAGDSRIQWELGFYLTPSTHGRGIMPAVLGSSIKNFLVPYMNVHHLTGAYFDHNPASRRVFEKNGFDFVNSVPEVFEIAESKTGVKGKMVGLGVMKWELKA